MRSSDELRHELNRATDLPYGRAHTAAVERVVAEADAGDVRPIALEARLALTSAYQQGAEPIKSFSSFAWTLAAWRSEPDRFDATQIHLLRWHFKYMVSNAIRFPDIALNQVRQVLDDMEHEYRLGACGMQPVHHYRHALARHVGDTVTAEREFEQWATLPRSALSDCVGCDPESMVEWHIENGRDDRALTIADDVLSGWVSCIEQPHSIRTTLLLTYLRLGRLDDARRAHVESYRSSRSNPDDLDKIARHVEFCALTGNEVRGLEIFERHLPWLASPRDTLSEMDFAACAALLLRRVGEVGHADAPVSDPDGETTTAAAAFTKWQDRATELADAFDRRNRTDAVSRRVRDRIARRPLVEHLPLGPVPSVFPGAHVGLARADRPVAEVSIAADADADVESLLTRFEQRWRVDRAEDTALVAATAQCADPRAAASAAMAIGLRAWQDHDLSDAVAALHGAVDGYGGRSPRGRHAATLLAFVELMRSRGDWAGSGPTDDRSAVDAAADEVVAAADEVVAVGAEPWMVAEAQRWAGVALALSDRGEVAADRLLTAAEPVDDPLVRSSYFFALAEVAAARGLLTDAASMAEQAMALRASMPQRAAQVAVLLMQLYLDTGRAADAAALAERVVADVAAPDAVRFRRLRGIALLDSGRRDEGIAELGALVAAHQVAGRTVDAATTSFPLAVGLLEQGRALDAAETLEASLPGYRQLGQPIATARTHALLVRALAALGETDDALRNADEAAAVFERSQQWDQLADVREHAGRAASAGHRPDLADPQYAAAADAAERYGESRWMLDLRLSQGSAQTLADPYVPADAFARATADIASLDADDDERAWFSAELHFRRAWALWQADLNDAAMPDAVAAEELFTRSGDERAAGRCALLRARLFAENDEFDEARSHAQRASAVFVRLGDEGLAAEAEGFVSALPGVGD